MGGNGLVVEPRVTLPSDTKNRGPLLTSTYSGGIDTLPQEWINIIGYQQVDQEVQLVVLPDNLTNVLLRSKTVQTRTDERKLTTYVIGGGTVPPGGWPPMVVFDRLPTGQLVTKTRSLVPDGTV